MIDRSNSFVLLLAFVGLACVPDRFPIVAGEDRPDPAEAAPPRRPDPPRLIFEESWHLDRIFMPLGGIPLLKPGPLLRRYLLKNVVFLQSRMRS
jgi:hypothetical protein